MTFPNLVDDTANLGNTATTNPAYPYQPANPNYCPGNNQNENPANAFIGNPNPQSDFGPANRNNTRNANYIFNPAVVEGIQLWFSADFGVFADTNFTTPQVTNGGAILGWQERSGNNNNASLVNSVCTFTTNSINGLPTIATNAGSLNLLLNVVCDNAWTIYCVGIPNLSNSHYYSPLGNTATDASGIFFESSSTHYGSVSNDTHESSSITLTGTSLTAPAVFRFRLSGIGVPAILGTGMTAEATGAAITLGTSTFNEIFASDAGSTNASNNFGEIILVNRDLLGTNDDLNIRNYLYARWALIL